MGTATRPWSGPERMLWFSGRCSSRSPVRLFSHSRGGLGGHSSRDELPLRLSYRENTAAEPGLASSRREGDRADRGGLHGSAEPGREAVVSAQSGGAPPDITDMTVAIYASPSPADPNRDRQLTELRAHAVLWRWPGSEATRGGAIRRHERPSSRSFRAVRPSHSRRRLHAHAFRAGAQCPRRARIGGVGKHHSGTTRDGRSERG